MHRHPSSSDFQWDDPRIKHQEFTNHMMEVSMAMGLPPVIIHVIFGFSVKPSSDLGVTPAIELIPIPRPGIESGSRLLECISWWRRLEIDVTREYLQFLCIYIYMCTYKVHIKYKHIHI